MKKISSLDGRWRSPKSRFLAIAVTAILTFFFLQILFLRVAFKFQDLDDEDPETPLQVYSWKSEKPRDFKGRIVLWTTYFSTYDYSPIGVSDSTFADCPYQCKFHSPKRGLQGLVRLRPNDAIIFHGRDLWRNFPHERHPNQVWIYLIQEGPLTTFDKLRNLGSIFNWTMTYRRDSEVQQGYGLVDRRNDVVPSFYFNHTLVAGKKKMAAAIVSHCTTASNRESLISDLQDFISVDVYGACGDFSCPNDSLGACLELDVFCRLQQYQSCYRKLAEDYKFFLSFENSLCLDYVTEKFYYALNTDIVPVVYGGANYSHVAPAGSYIDARSFESPAALVKYLMYLDAHPDEYAKYFEWKRMHYADVSQTRGWCDLCMRLHTDTHTFRTYKNLTQWWYSTNRDDSDRLMPKANACEVHRPEYRHDGWRDASKNGLYFVAGHETKFPNDTDTEIPEGGYE